MKPSESTPLSGAALAQAVIDAGFSAGAVNGPCGAVKERIVTGGGPPVSTHW